MKRNRRQRAHRFGHAAEAACAGMLRLKGYRILAKRLRTSHGEIDLLARRGKVLAIIEVKARIDGDAALESVTPYKRLRLTRAASALPLHAGQIAGLADLSCLTLRFDIMVVTPWRMPRHLQDAWRENA